MIEKNRVYQLVLHIIMVLLTLFCVLPFALLIASSMTDETTLIRNGYSFWPSKVDFSAYRYILLDSGDVLRGYVISALVTLVGTLMNLTLTTMYAYPLSRKKLPGRRFFSFYLFFTMLFSGGLVPSYIMWTRYFHIKNTIFALLVPNLLMSAFYVIMLRTFITASVYEDVIDAGRIDGLGEFGIVRHIVLPMCKPALATIALLVGLSYWNDWMNGLYYISNEKLYSIQVLLNRMLMDTTYLMSSAAGQQVDTSLLPSTGIKMAIAVMGVLPILVIYPFVQNSLVQGITIGSVKG